MPTDAYNYTMISVEIEEGVAWATVDNPPINLITLPLFGELRQLGLDIEADDDVRVVAFGPAPCMSPALANEAKFGLPLS